MSKSGWDKPLDQMTAFIDSVDFRAQNIEPVIMGPCNDLHSKQIDEAFKTQGASTKFGSWKPIKGGGRVLFKTGRLRDSYVVQGNADRVYELRGTELKAGSRFHTALFHQNGFNKRGGGRVEARKLDKTNAQQEAFDDLVC